jgi:hypothetical protein
MVVALTASIRGDAAGQEEARPAPETDKPLSATTGYLLTAAHGCSIEAIRLPTLEKTLVRSAAPEGARDYPTLHAISGPDAEGRIAYIEDHFFVTPETKRRHLLKTIRIDGTRDTALFTRPGDAMWATTAAGKGEIGRSLSLSPIGGRVAVITELSHVPSPVGCPYAGSIEVWDLAKKEGTKTDTKALDWGLAWFPDGKRIAYVKFARPAEVGNPSFRAGSFGASFRDWVEIPSVFVRDVDAGAESFLHMGLSPVVSPDGRSVLVSDWEDAYVRVDVATRETAKVSWRDRADPRASDSRVIAYPAKDLVITATWRRKVEPARSPRGLLGFLGFLARKPPTHTVTLGPARLNTDELRTVATVEGGFAGASFGQMREEREK